MTTYNNVKLSNKDLSIMEEMYLDSCVAEFYEEHGYFSSEDPTGPYDEDYHLKVMLRDGGYWV